MPAFLASSVRRISSVARLHVVSAPTTPGPVSPAPSVHRSTSAADLTQRAKTSTPPNAGGWSFSRVLGFAVTPSRPQLRPVAVSVPPSPIESPLPSPTPSAEDDDEAVDMPVGAGLSRTYVFASAFANDWTRLTRAVTFRTVFRTPVARTCAKFGTYVKHVTAGGGSSPSTTAPSSPTAVGPVFSTKQTTPAIHHQSLSVGSPDALVKVLYQDGRLVEFDPTGLTVPDLARRIEAHSHDMMKRNRLLSAAHDL